MQATNNFPRIQNLVLRVRHSQIILGFILLMFLADGANSILESIGAPFYRISIFVRIIALVYFLYLSLIYIPSGKNVWFLLFFFYGVLLIGTLAMQRFVPGFSYFEGFSMVNKLLFYFVCLVVFHHYFNGGREENESLFRIFELIVLIELVTVMAGYAFDIDIFSSYGQRRFGYKGFIPAQNEVSGFFIIAFFYFLAKVITYNRDLFKLILVLLGAVMTGTKALLILPLITFLLVLYWLLRRRVRKTYLVLGVVFFVLVGITLFEMDYVLERISPTIEYYTYWVVSKSYSPLNLVASGRDSYISRFFSDYLPYFNVLNYLFGGLDLSNFSTETDVIDVFARLGLVGGAVFYLFYLKTLIGSTRSHSLARVLFVITWMGVSATAGHLVFSAINGVYLAILVIAFSSMEKNQLNLYHEKTLVT